MSVRVTRAGQMVDRVYGDGSIGPTDRRVSLGYSTVEDEGTVLRDDEVSEDLLARVKAGEVPGLAYLAEDDESSDGDEEADAESTPPDLQKLMDENDNLSTQVADLGARIADLEAEASEKDARIAELESNLGAAQTARAASLGQEGSAGTAQETADQYDPNDHVQADVLEYLKTADADEVARVQEAEAAGQGRKGIAEFSPPSTTGSFE